MEGLQSSDDGTKLVYQPGRHIAQLDGLRGLAIVLVTLYRLGKELPTETWPGLLLSNVLVAGKHGVELFFVLSGFLITGILLDSRGVPNQLRNFFIRRSLRILPLYMVTLAVMSITVGWLSHWRVAPGLVESFRTAYDQQLYLWCYLTNVRMSWVGTWCFGPMDHFWSLAVEEHFYLIWPLVVVICLPRRLLTVAVVGAMVAIAMRVLWLALGGTSTVAEVFTLMRCDGLLLGSGLAALIRTRQDWLSYRPWAIGCCVVFLLAGVVLTCSQRRFWMGSSVCWTLGWSALMIWLLTSQTNSWLAWVMDRKLLRNLGQLSYAMYVFQAPLIPIVAWLGLRAGWGDTASLALAWHLVYMAVMFALIVGLAWCSWHLFEKHWLRLKEIFPQTPSRTQPTSMVREGGVLPA